MTQLGRQVRASANHQFLTIEGWKRLDALKPGEFIALPRTLEGIDDADVKINDNQAALLGHLLGDGCTLPRHAVQYTTNDPTLANLVAVLATEIFGETVEPRIVRERQWFQVYLSAAEHLTHGKRNPVAEWLETLGAWGYRSHEKRVPEALFAQPSRIIARFLRHLWTTDGTMGVFGQKRPRAVITYTTSSEALAQDVQHLLLRLGIIARTHRVPQRGRGRDQWHVVITGKPDVTAFLDKIGVLSSKENVALKIQEFYRDRTHNTNRDVIPKQVWKSLVEPARRQSGVSQREFQAALGTQYCGTALFKSNLSRERALKVGEIVASEELIQLAQSDLYWDKIASLDPDGEEDVYDVTVPGHHNFIAGDIIVHNSLEQDADIVMFIYRDELYNENSENPNIADVMIAKHRSGPTGTVQLYFNKRLTQFLDAATHVSPNDYSLGP